MPNVQPSGFAGDDGGADPDLVRALAEYAASGAAYPVLAALSRARLLVPVVAAPAAADDGAAAGGTEMATVFFERPDGRRALLAFTGVEAMRTWDAAARPRPLWMRDVAEAAAAEGADAVLVDLAGPVRFAVEAGELRHLAQGHAVVRTPTGHAWFALP